MHKNYKYHLSGYMEWEQKEHAEDWVLYEQNLGEHMCIDEVALTSGELYTTVTNASARTQKGALVAMIRGTKTEDIESVLQKIPLQKRQLVKYVTTDLASNIQSAAMGSFPDAKLISDRFHVYQLVTEALQELRMQYRREAIAMENQAVKEARKTRKRYKAEVLKNGDTRKQLLARSRYILFKPEHKWTQTQKERAGILFREYPDLKKGYKLSMNFRSIYEHSVDKQDALERLEKWYRKVDQSDFASFVTASESIKVHEISILHYFEKKLTNALAETFHSKVKSFRSIFRGVRDRSFFLFRVSTIFS